MVGKDPPNWNPRRGGSLYLSEEEFLFCMVLAAIIQGVEIFHFCHCAVAASGSSMFVRLLRVNSCGSGLPNTTYSEGVVRNLPPIFPDIPELLTVKALSQTSLSSVGLNPDDDMAEVGQFKYFQGGLTDRQSQSNFNSEKLPQALMVDVIECTEKSSGEFFGCAWYL
jgi:hypothetical protein